MMNGNHIALLEQADDLPLLARTKTWARVNSGSTNLDGLTRMADLLADAFAVLPGDLALIEADPVEAVRSDGSVAEVARGRHLHLSVRGDAPVRVLLTGHMDTVFAADHPFQSLEWIEDGVLNGPGTTDMKGGLSTMLGALQLVERSGLAPRIGYEVMINSDEEVGSASSAALIERCAAGKAAALTYEPALPDGTLAGARGGSGNFAIVVTGRAAHAGRNPDEGRNALVAAADCALQLKALHRHGLSANPARIEGGGPNNAVPDHAILHVNFRPLGPDDEAQAAREIERITERVARAHDVKIVRHGGFGRPPKPIDNGAAKLFDLVKQCGAEIGIDIAWKATGGVCDGNNIAACGVPVVDTMGVRGGAIHSADEYMIADSLPERTRLSALTLLRLAERGGL